MSSPSKSPSLNATSSAMIAALNELNQHVSPSRLTTTSSSSASLQSPSANSRPSTSSPLSNKPDFLSMIPNNPASLRRSPKSPSPLALSHPSTMPSSPNRQLAPPSISDHNDLDGKLNQVTHSIYRFRHLYKITFKHRGPKQRRMIKSNR